jgi:hypothetical protein
MSRKTWLWIGGLCGVVVIVAGLALFQPWRLWTTTVVAETLPPASSPAPTASATPSTQESAPAPTPEYVDLAAGTFISHEHGTSGTARIVQQPDGSRVLAIEGLTTSDGPDLRVWLTDQPVIEGVDGWYVFDDGLHVELGPLRGNVGDLVYPIPDDVDLQALTSVSIWCARFAVSFGAAELQPV